MTPRALLAAALALTTLGTATPSLAAAAATAGTAPLAVVRLNEPVNLTQGGDTRALSAATALTAGDVLSAGVRGKAALQFAGNGLLTLSSLGELQVYEAQAARGKQLALAKLKLLGGALRVDSRAANGQPAQDVRLNVGSLKTRITNAYAWAANTAEGDTLCLLAGSVSVQTGGSTDERLGAAGSCLRREPDGQLSRFTIDSDPVVTGAIDATRFSDETFALPAPAPTPAPAPAPAAVTVAKPAPVSAPIIAAPAPAPAAVATSAPVAAAPVSPPAAGAPPPPAADAKGWTVVVLSLSRAEPVEARARALSDQGLPAATRSTTVNGMTMHRVIVGSFATQAQARSYAGQTLARNGIKGWAAPL